MNEISKIVIVHGKARMYREVIETIQQEFSRVKIDPHELKECKPFGLESLIKEMQARNLQNNYIEEDYELIGGSLKVKSFMITIH